MFRRSRLVVGAVVAALATLTMATAPSGAAVRPFNPPQTVVGSCNAVWADAVVTTGGSLLGFATCPNSGDSIRFFSRTPAGVVNSSQGTGFAPGRVLGVSYDDTATYVLFATSLDIRIGKRTHAGVFSSRVVDTGVGGATLPFGDVIARNGQWFGVWSKQVGPGGEFAQTELFSAGSTIPVQQLTSTGANEDDTEPTLAYSASTPVLIWTRVFSPAEPGPSDLMLSKYTAGSWEPERIFASAGHENLRPDIQIAAGRTFVTWNRDGFVWVASNHTGSFTSKRFLTAGAAPKVALSVTGSNVDHIFLSWRVFAAGTGVPKVFFAESASSGSVTGTWDGTTLAPSNVIGFATGGFAGKGTVVYSSQASNAMVVRSQT